MTKLWLARAVGVDLEKDIVGRLATKKASDIVLLDSQQRAAKMYLGLADGSRATLDVLHHAAHAARARSLEAACELLEKGRLARRADISCGVASSVRSATGLGHFL